ncbi:hypothetical protein FH972_024428 [Carpinus fangiana]|uniref:Major facilitator superfamily (MFS) profile domain-containing protein n=1 Tax=Carpinus fangiana TaxID=176857 RepID=A0A5N6KYB5_9ROSI|nr:hypothetical protein FH972_024428 [Carpinus fangiana]
MLMSSGQHHDAEKDNDLEKVIANLHHLGIRSEDVPGHGRCFLVDFENEDPFLAKNWSYGRKWATTGIVGLTGFLVAWSSAIDSVIVPQAMQEFGTSEIVENLATALFLIGFGLGSLVSGPLSETIGRNLVYLGSLAIFMVWVMASGLAPNIQSQLVFRTLAGFFGCTPLTTFGGSTSDIWDSAQRTYVFPVMACLSFLGPFLSPMVGSCMSSNPIPICRTDLLTLNDTVIGQSSIISWRWTEWITLIMAALITSAIFLTARESYPPVLLEWKTAHLRRLFGDERFVSAATLHKKSFLSRMRVSIVRPFEFFFTQAIVVLWCAYLSLVYVILFTFLPGYNYIFGRTYGFGQGSTGLMFIGLNVGFLIALAMCPFVYSRYIRVMRKHNGAAPPEERLVYANLTAPLLPISLFWMAWTARSDISFWSPLIASVAFGISMQGIFISAYQYLIDSFEAFAASALVSLTLSRYIAAGLMTVAANPMYEALHVEWTLTLLGCLGVICTPIPYCLYYYGAKIRARTVPGK